MLCSKGYKIKKNIFYFWNYNKKFPESWLSGNRDLFTKLLKEDVHNCGEKPF